MDIAFSFEAYRIPSQRNPFTLRQTRSGVVRHSLRIDPNALRYTILIATRSVARLITVEFDAAIADDDSPQVLASTQPLLRLAVVCRAYPGMVPALLCMRVRRSVVDESSVAIENNLLRIRELDVISEEPPDEARAIHTLLETLQGERAYCFPILFNLNRCQDIHPKDGNGKVLMARAT